MKDSDIFKRHGKCFSKKDFKNPDNERLYCAYLYGCDAREEELSENCNPYETYDWRYDAWICGYSTGDGE